MVQHDNNTILHQEDTATNGMPDDDKATSTKDKTIIIHNHIYTDTNKGNGPTKNHVQLQRTITRDEELEKVQTLADNPSRQPFLGYDRASNTVNILAKLLTGPPLYHRRRQ
jgi:hypothetical protein